MRREGWGRALHSTGSSLGTPGGPGGPSSPSRAWEGAPRGLAGVLIDKGTVCTSHTTWPLDADRLYPTCCSAKGDHGSVFPPWRQSWLLDSRRWSCTVLSGRLERLQGQFGAGLTFPGPGGSGTWPRLRHSTVLSVCSCQAPRCR